MYNINMKKIFSKTCVGLAALALIVFSLLPFCGCGKPDYMALINRITLEKMSANVCIENKCSKFGGYEIFQGSGVIIARNEYSSGEYLYYYLTNYHVVEKEAGFTLQEFTVFDYKDNAYSSKPVYSAENFDLALMSFSAEEELAVIELGESDMSALGYVFAVGQPHGQHNAVTSGTTLGVADAPESEGRKLPFNVIMHSAFISNGSSGGMLLNADLKLIGINYAGGVDENGDFAYAYAIPVSRVKEFLENSGVFS